jgi:hemerythrin superfamily protein
LQNLTQELRDEHAKILNTLIQAKELCVKTLAGHDKLNESITALLAHLKKEDELFYPKLKKAAKNDPQLQTMLKLFEDDIKTVTEMADNFRWQYTDDCESLDFITEFGTLFIMLRDRITREENTLFPEYETRCCD